MSKKSVLFVVLFILMGYSYICLCHTLQYNINTYSCMKMSRDIEDTLELFNIDVTIHVGWKNESTKGHMWFSIYGVEFDSITLLPLPESLIYPRNQKTYDDYIEYEYL